MHKTVFSARHETAEMRPTLLLAHCGAELGPVRPSGSMGGRGMMAGHHRRSVAARPAATSRHGQIRDAPIRAVDRLRRNGYRYKKAGVELGSSRIAGAGGR